jgi:hypothetical protein
VARRIWIGRLVRKGGVVMTMCMCMMVYDDSSVILRFSRWAVIVSSRHCECINYHVVLSLGSIEVVAIVHATQPPEQCLASCGILQG